MTIASTVISDPQYHIWPFREEWEWLRSLSQNRFQEVPSAEQLDFQTRVQAACDKLLLQLGEYR